jgi:nucleoside-diphosphate-sugar epimerase
MDMAEFFSSADCMHSTKTIAIVGASGHIGRYLVAELRRLGGYRIKLLARSFDHSPVNTACNEGVEIFKGDLREPESLKDFFEHNCIVINLVYLWGAGESVNLEVTANLLAACKAAKVARLIHCSTVAVAGRTRHDLIDEKTQCLPITEYGISKLRIEQSIIDFAKEHFDTVILRPTSVFGINAEPLKKLSTDISRGSRWKNYLKFCLFGRRRMNLVHVANVVAAIIFLAQYAGRFKGEVFIVSDDDDPKNNFMDVEGLLMDALEVKKYRLPRLALPLTLLKWLLMLMGRNNVNPRCNFDPSKLRKLGFKSPVSLSEGVAEYSTWYRESHFGEKGSKAS